MNPNWSERLQTWISEHREEALELTRSLVSLRSINRVPHGEEWQVQQYVADYLRKLGCGTDMFLPTDVRELTAHPAYLEGRNYQDRPNVVGRRKGSGGGKSLLFSGHVDTVPLNKEETWTVDPLSGVIKEGKQYGLGIFDMKAGIAASLFALRGLVELGIPLKGDVVIETVVDEEYGGANGTLASRLRGHHADAAIIPEPSNLVICPATQGGIMLRIRFAGTGGRNFSGEIVTNPVFAAARFIEIFRQYDRAHSMKASLNPWYKDGPGLTSYLQGMKAGDVSLPLSDRTPNQCSIDVWIQCYPGTSEKELYQDFTGFCLEQAAEDELLKQFPPQFERLIRFLPGTSLAPGHPLIETAVQVVQAAAPQQLAVKGAPFACDAFMFEQYSEIPVIVWGPSGGNAHAADEFIHVDDYLQLIHWYSLMMMEWCGVE
ncbi:M20/M25/M40 family metallo-hydrolase [Paenibacillus senegalensis]|uniref:M20/M25/M40 family metallo-hydrolase n=1 Tax=Paenibacillus senegalensis TaxID=1465766 RepID=UPI000289DE52|nr:M20/M25/M40 family metallo-hydrolase [Paenibacillus senegalensis]